MRFLASDGHHNHHNFEPQSTCFDCCAEPKGHGPDLLSSKRSGIRDLVPVKLKWPGEVWCLVKDKLRGKREYHQKMVASAGDYCYF
ncbi:hypothetical protein TNCT_538981 [Trichonephila clavata]|uniref:Uncharacterized protein n=1 Tax=Trichonephila clavata TaxID=2740835 RepID=A0A8X6LE65_TRICU|nr:hypothetical protein TNCT_538981 [Trichonephila clavata]